MTKHTPGPWWVAENYTSVLGNPKSAHHDDVVIVADCDPDDLCTAPGGQKEYNARLIAASPDLLAALKRCVEVGSIIANEEKGIKPLAWLEQARAAIAKAEGKDR